MVEVNGLDMTLSLEELEIYKVSMEIGELVHEIVSGAEPVRSLEEEEGRLSREFRRRASGLETIGKP